jgi:hypothetical protein
VIEELGFNLAANVVSVCFPKSSGSLAENNFNFSTKKSRLLKLKFIYLAHSVYSFRNHPMKIVCLHAEFFAALTPPHTPLSVLAKFFAVRSLYPDAFVALVVVLPEEYYAIVLFFLAELKHISISSTSEFLGGVFLLRRVSIKRTLLVENSFETS